MIINRTQELLDQFGVTSEEELKRKLWETALTLECKGCGQIPCVCYLLEGDPFYPACNNKER